MDEFNEWLKTRPKVIQELGAKYPPDTLYIVKKGAPYGISCEGSIVEVDSYTESGDVGVIVLAEYKTPECEAHEMALCTEHDADYSEIKKANIKCYIDPVWIEPYTKNNARKRHAN